MTAEENISAPPRTHGPRALEGIVARIGLGRHGSGAGGPESWPPARIPRFAVTRRG